MITGPASKRLRFEYIPAAGESLVGAFAAACRRQRLRNLASALEGAGLRFAPYGNIQFATKHEKGRLAFAMRIGEGALEGFGYGAGANREASIADLTLPRSVIETSRRRIAPKRLLLDPIHRADWLNLLLPYCRTTGERLVDECPECGPLGWARTRGIDRCEACGEVVPPSVEPPLPAALTDDYATFANLTSPDPVAVARARATFPANVNRFPRTALVMTAIKFAVWGREDDEGNLFARLAGADPAELAATVSRAMALLREAPASLRQIVATSIEEAADDRNAYRIVRNKLRSIAKIGSGEDDANVIDLVSPTLDGRTVDVLATSGQRYYTATETTTLLWISSSELAELREARGVRYEELPGGLRKRVRYDADDVDRLRTMLADSVSPSTIAADFDVPVYAIEQLVHADLLSASLDAGIVAVRREFQIDRRSAAAFKTDLLRTSSGTNPPPGSVPLRSALLGYGGEKPWAAAFASLLSGAVRFHLSSDDPTGRSIMVDARDLQRLSHREPTGSQGPLVKVMSLRDAAGVLGTGHPECRAALRSANIEVFPHGKGLAVDRMAVRDLAREVVFVGEAAAWSNRSIVSVHRQLTGEGLEMLHGGWPRAVLAPRGLAETLG